jgi:ribosome-associated translation inhibitor RaiA
MRKTTSIRQPVSAKRTPMASYIARPVKRTNGRTVALVPAYIRSVDRALNAEDRAYVRRKLGTKLGKFVRSIERVSVRVEDVNGPRGGVDTACRIKVVLRGLPSVVVEEQNALLQAAIDRALSRTERAVRRSVQRRRTRSTGRRAI